MTWTTNIRGHNPYDSDEEHQTAEEELVAKVKAFVATLEGTTTATVRGNKIGTVNALQQS